MVRRNPRNGTANGPSIKLTWWAAKNTWQKVIGKIGQFEGEEGHVPLDLVAATPKKWYFGPDRGAAEIAAHRLVQLWREIQALGLRNGIQLYIQLLAMSIRAQLQYRVSFVLSASGQFLTTGVEFLGIWALFARFDQLQAGRCRRSRCSTAR
ncbi:hypothetical protein ACERK3_14110 [Phycisphaerales bacterium AB-hyl4]|uniref:Uncharacterized protein n=1 Tax=Natronomicrosphaera hydrolytica TaxID=3242702 RepID=A0ABV4U755_9BACT